MLVRYAVAAVVLAATLFVACPGSLLADGAGDPAAVRNDDGKYYDKAGNPTFKVQDGIVDWYTYFRVPPLPLGMPRLPWP